MNVNVQNQTFSWFWNNRSALHVKACADLLIKPILRWN